jgi:hypothetical protein
MAELYTCDACKWYIGTHTAEDGKSGDCRHNAPRIWQVADGTDYARSGTGWPRVATKDFCGDFEDE